MAGETITAWALVSAYMQQGWRLFLVERQSSTSAADGSVRIYAAWELREIAEDGRVLATRPVADRVAEGMRNRMRLAPSETNRDEWLLAPPARRKPKGASA